MRISTYSVTNRIIEFVDVSNITGNENVDTFHFDFDSEWDVFSYKYLVLLVGTKAYIDPLDSNNNVILRSIAYDKDNVTFGVVGFTSALSQTGELDSIDYVYTSGTSILSTNIVWLETIPSAWGQIVDVDGLPDKTVWQTYTEEILALVAQGQITLEQCQQALNDTQTARDLAQEYMNDAKEYSEDAEGYKNDTAGLKQDVVDIVNSFNLNAQQKTDSFNQNYNDKLGSFNQNVADKTTVFNNNATSKTNEFNSNATLITNAFNQNAQEKLDAVIGAGITAVDSVESAKNTAINNIEILAEEKTAEFDEHTEEFQEQINTNSENISEIQTDLELFESNFDPKTVTLNENGLIEDALNWKVKYYSPIGKTSQDSYTGKNLLRCSLVQEKVLNGITITPQFDDTENLLYVSLNGTSTSTMTIAIGSFTPEINTQYKVNGCPTGGTEATAYVYVTGGISNKNGADTLATWATDGSKAYQIIVADGVTLTDMKFYPMIRLASITDSAYEPYVGNQPSPSPDFQQPIENVIGDVKTETNDINLFDSKLLTQEPDYNTYDKSTGLWTTSNLGGYFRSIFYKVGDAGTIKNVSKLVKLKAGNYTIKFFDFSATSSANNAISILLIDKDGNKISIIQSSISNKDTIPITLEEDYYIDIARTDSTGTLSFSNIMIAEGTYTTNTFPSFAEHQGKSITFPLSQGQKMYEGDYLSDDGIHHVRGQVVFDGTESWWGRTVYDDGTCFWIANERVRNCVIARSNKSCTHFIYINNTHGNVEMNTLCENSTSPMWVFKVDFVTTLDEWKAWLAEQYTNGTPVIGEYNLAQEEIDQYTSEQQTAWNELKELETYKKQTHIYTSSDGISPDSKVTYLVDPLVERDSRLDALEQAVVALNSNN